ncbi:hypothetical protein E2986_07148 [Frieseomelitta varia]|uniref:Uncharacterized protein n=1 Tax=Frieseomelitta varia TaxID=561572 RepID=A0A833RXB6_9HYME|nr:hypothetical protein E2986_07148 [Frieseomelitta varia]
MSNQFVTKDRIVISDRKDQSKLIINVKESTLSERTIPKIQVTLRKIQSEIQIESNVDYDNLCGPWVYSENPLQSTYICSPQPSLCIWKYFTEEDVIYLKKYQENKNLICSFFVYIEIYFRLNLFSGKAISACLGIVYLTHLFFLSCPWCATQEVHQFFYKTMLLHVVLYPPKGLEIFTIKECKLLFELFHKVYIKNLVLLHILCHTNYHFTLKLQTSRNSIIKD